jgi:hypothetical protein
MIKITKGNPTPGEIAALVAALALANGTTKRRITSSTAGKWLRSTPFDEVNPAVLSRRGRCWRPSSAGWSHVGPAHGSQLPRQRHSVCKRADLRGWNHAVGTT